MIGFYLFLEFLLFFVIGYSFGSIVFGLILSKIKHKDLRSHGSGNVGATNTLRIFGVGAASVAFLWDMFKTWLSIMICTIIYQYINEKLFINDFQEYQKYGFLIYFAGLGTIVGHCLPVVYLFFLFKYKFNFEKARKYIGGKGAASTAGFFLALSPWIFLIGFALFWIFFFSSRYVSLSSIFSIFVTTFFLLIPQLDYFYILNINNANIINVQNINDSINNLSVSYIDYWWYIINNFLLSFLISIIVIYKHKKNIINLINHKEKKLFSKK